MHIKVVQYDDAYFFTEFMFIVYFMRRYKIFGSRKSYIETVNSNFFWANHFLYSHEEE